MNPRLFYMLAPISATHGSVWITLSTENSEDQKVDTNIKTAFTNWDPVHAIIKATDEESALAGQSFEGLKKYLKAALEKATIEGELIEPNWLSKHVSICFQHAKKTSESALLFHIQKYIDAAPLRRIKRTGSLGLSKRSVRNLRRFYALKESFEASTEQTVLLENIDHKLVKQFKYWLLNTMGCWKMLSYRIW